MTRTSSRLPLLDLLKAAASQLIVLHHLAFYGPMSDAAYALIPSGIDWLYDYARIAVQVFLVIAGFLAARGLAPDAMPREQHSLPRLLLARYCRLALPLTVAVILSILSASIARQLMVHESIPDTPELWQFISHTLLLHGVTEQESLSAGVWYVAIDFQLFAAFAGMLWLAGKLPRWRGASGLLVGAMAVASLFVFNRQAELDSWWIYFFGSYAMGIAAQWAGRSRNGLLWLALLAVVGLSALGVEFRSRIALALSVALMLGLSLRQGWLERCPSFALTSWLSRISYSVFLIHFPVCLLTNAIIFKLAPDSAVINLAGMILAWQLSIAAGHQFHRHVESRLAHLSPVQLLPAFLRPQEQRTR